MKKLELSLPALTGDDDEDVQMLEDLYRALTGKECTEAERREMAAALKDSPQS